MRDMSGWVHLSSTVCSLWGPTAPKRSLLIKVAACTWASYEVRCKKNPKAENFEKNLSGKRIEKNIARGKLVILVKIAALGFFLQRSSS